MNSKLKLFEAAFGVNVNQIEDINKKKDNFVKKHGHQSIDFNVGIEGIKRVYNK